MSMVVYGMKANIPPDSDGKNRLPNADIRYAVVDEWGCLDVNIISINGMNAAIEKGKGRGARSEVNEGLKERAKKLALFDYFFNVKKDEY